MILMEIKGTMAQGTLVRDALCSRHHYKKQITNDKGELIDNPETKTAFAKRMIMEYLKNEAKAYRLDQFNLTKEQTLTNAEAEVDGVTVE